MNRKGTNLPVRHCLFTMKSKFLPNSTHSIFRYLGGVMLLAIIYALAGWVGLWLAVPPGYATAIWPSSGIAMAVLLVWGVRFWPGVWLGSFLINCWITFNTPPTFDDLNLLAVPLSIGIGAVLQATVGAFLIHRFVGYPTPLFNERQIGLFFGLGGGVSCLLSATWGITTLLVAGKLSWDQAWWSGWNWWIGISWGYSFSPR